MLLIYFNLKRSEDDTEDGDYAEDMETTEEDVEDQEMEERSKSKKKKMSSDDEDFEWDGFCSLQQAMQTQQHDNIKYHD